jgi:hypothetical protein
LVASFELFLWRNSALRVDDVVAGMLSGPFKKTRDGKLLVTDVELLRLLVDHLRNVAHDAGQADEVEALLEADATLQP